MGFLLFFLLLSLSFLLVSGIFERLCMRVRACKLRCIFERSWTKLWLGLCPFVCSELILEGFFLFLFLFVFFYLPSELVFNSDVLLKVTSLFQDKKRKNSTINSRTLVSSPSGASFYGYFVAKKKKKDGPFSGSET